MGVFRDLSSHVDISSVSRLTIETWESRRHPLLSVRKFFRWLKKTAHWIKRNPMKKVQVPKCGRRTRIARRREWILLRERAPLPLRRCVLAMGESGARPGEVRSLRWEWIHSSLEDPLSAESLAGGFSYWVLPEYKGRKWRADPNRPRFIAISPRLGRLLLRMSRGVTPLVGHIFLSKRRRPWTPNSLRCSWRYLRAKLWAHDRISPVDLVPYMLRHTKATELGRAGNNARLLADFLGHSTLEMTSWYIHAEADDLCRMLRPKPKE